MSSHFNYEIEERNMRNQLKELEVPFKEEAWYNYEAYAKQFQSVHKTQLLTNFNFALNRTLILPIVFGGIIILFSFLLFNFINIKNTKTKPEVSEATPPVTSLKPKPEPKKQIIVPVKKEEITVHENALSTTSMVANNTLIAVPVANTNTFAARTMPQAIPTTTFAAAAVVTNTVAQDSQLTNLVPTYTFAPKKKKRKKGSAEVLESIATPVSLPTVTEEEAEPELR
ncbi:MAG: hypothetical protein Q8L81_04835 [Bacteroidota bacterium]|nr:hypothetical protein [Bacteroidota bacterium]